MFKFGSLAALAATTYAGEIVEAKSVDIDDKNDKEIAEAQLFGEWDLLKNDNGKYDMVLTLTQ